MVWRYSKIANANANADPTINFAEGQAPSSLNDSDRAQMARIAQWRDDISGAITTGGTATAYTVSSNQVFDTFAHMDGAMIAFVPHATNTSGGGTTLNVDGLGARALRASPGIELVDGHIILGTPYVVTYSNSDSSFYLRGGASNPYNVPLGGMMDYTAFSPPNSCFIFPTGQAISRTTYSAYFSLVSTSFGAGDGTTTFNVIDLRGRVTVANDSGAGRMSGLGLNTTGGITNALQNLAISQLPNYNPTFTGFNDPVAVDSSQGYFTGNSSSSGGPTGPITLPAGPQVVHSTGTFTPRGNISSINGGVAQTALNVAMPYIGVNKILRVI